MRANKKLQSRGLSFLLLLIPFITQAQLKLGVGKQYEKPQAIEVDYAQPKEYTIAGITVSGIKFLDPNTLISVSGINVNDRITIPGERISTAVRRLMEQGIIEDVAINITKIEGDKVYLDINLRERPRLNKFVYRGLRKGEQDGVNDKIKTNKGKVITDALVKNIQLTIKKYFIEKGFLNTTVQVKQVTDTIRANNATLYITIDKKNKVKIDDIIVNGIVEMPEYKVLSKLKGTKERAPL